MVEWQLQSAEHTEDLPLVLRWFTDPEFYFGTSTPHLLSEPEIVSLLDEPNTYLVYHDMQPIGLLRTEYAESYAGTVALTLRLQRGTPFALWTSLLSLLPALVWEQLDFWRIQVVCPEFDELLQRACAAAGYGDEGLLKNVYYARGRRWGARHFAVLRAANGRVARGQSSAQAV
jgi:hypothetical protein